MLVITPMKGLLVDGMTGIQVRCVYNIGDVTLTLPQGVNGSRGIFIRLVYQSGVMSTNVYSPQSSGGVVTGSGGSPFLQMAVRDGHGITGDIVQAASVGQRITLDVTMQDTSTVYAFPYNPTYVSSNLRFLRARLLCARRIKQARGEY
jgi:hypothetical protein